MFKELVTSIETLLTALEKLTAIDEFNIEDRALYIDAVTHYRSFIQLYLRDIFKAQKIEIDYVMFIKYEFFTLGFQSVAPQDQELLLAIGDILTVRKEISRDQAKQIIFGITKLEWLLPKYENLDFLESWVFHFDIDLRRGNNPLVDWLMDKVATDVGLNRQIITQELDSKKVTPLIKELQRALTKLQEKWQSPTDKTPLLLKIVPLTTLQPLSNILSSSQTPDQKIISLRDKWVRCSQLLAPQNKDPNKLILTQFLKEISAILKIPAPNLVSGYKQGFYYQPNASQFGNEKMRQESPSTDKQIVNY